MIGQKFNHKSLGDIVILDECIPFDGIGSFVLCIICNASYYPFAVWFRSNDGDLKTGNYSKTLDDARENYNRRTN